MKMMHLKSFLQSVRIAKNLPGLKDAIPTPPTISPRTSLLIYKVSKPHSEVQLARCYTAPSDLTKTSETRMGWG